MSSRQPIIGDGGEAIVAEPEFTPEDVPSDLEAALRAAEAEVARLTSENIELQLFLTAARKSCDILKALVDRLPKTADGVPIALKMEVWTKWSPHALVVTRIEVIPTGSVCVRLCRESEDVDVLHDYVSPDQCYSTSEALEAARTA